MARWGDYEGLNREVKEARMRNGLDPICRCGCCGCGLFFGERVLEFECEIYCEDCGMDVVAQRKRYLGSEDIYI